MPSETSRLGLQYPLASDLPNGAYDIETIANELDVLVDGYAEGTAANRSTAWPAPPDGARYYATDTKVTSVYHSGSWVSLISSADVLAAVLPLVYPVGCVYINQTNVNPETELGFGTWTAYAPGRVLIGVGTLDDGTTTETFSTNETGGEFLHSLVLAEVPAIETNVISVATSGSALNALGSEAGTGGVNLGGTGAGHNNIQPFKAVNYWLRTA